MRAKKFVISMVLGLSAFLPSMVFSACIDDHPISTIMTTGGGQSASVNDTLLSTFRGHIMTADGLTNHGRNAVTICRGTTVEYSSGSTVTNGLYTRPDCLDKNSYGVLAVGDKISCNNKNLGGSDTDRFTVKAGR